ncbi:MAG: pyridoxal 5'-phosphate synthase glutaminase subunit PdxT [Actinobacteria bacterium]|nr:pyridoxal 5'-phosphate synthase glutaminase subunit PdxT [Actinomycetota bacterium]
MVKKEVGIKVGVLSLQGAFKEHVSRLEECGVSVVEVRLPEQFKDIDGLIIPGGESTTINKLLKKYKFKESLDKFYRDRKPIFGTCAGLILLAKNITGEGKGLGYIDIEVQRNAYGRQVDSFEELLDISFNQNENGRKFKSIFIRAPKILSVGRKVEVLAKLKDEIVLVRDNNVMVCTFHPELTDDLRIHNYFINMIKNYKGEN